MFFEALGNMIRVVHPGSEYFTHPGSRGQKGTGFQIRNTTCKHFFASQFYLNGNFDKQIIQYGAGTCLTFGIGKYSVLITATWCRMLSGKHQLVPAGSAFPPPRWRSTSSCPWGSTSTSPCPRAASHHSTS
jgi:hypothetical protein